MPRFCEKVSPAGRKEGLNKSGNARSTKKAAREPKIAEGNLRFAGYFALCAFPPLITPEKRLHTDPANETPQVHGIAPAAFDEFFSPVTTAV
jgi:hypothetical protein